MVSDMAAAGSGRRWRTLAARRGSRRAGGSGLVTGGGGRSEAVGAGGGGGGGAGASAGAGPAFGMRTGMGNTGAGRGGRGPSAMCTPLPRPVVVVDVITSPRAVPRAVTRSPCPSIYDTATRADERVTRALLRGLNCGGSAGPG